MRWLFSPVRFAVALLALASLTSVAPAAVHGGIEIGAKGVKAIVIDFTPTADGYDLNVLFSDTTNTALASGISATGKFDPKAVTATAEAVTKYATKMRDEFKIAPNRLYVVGSSGLFSAVEDKPDTVAANRDVLAKAVDEAAKVKMAFIDARKEAELSVAGIVPKRFRSEAALIDVGGGNTKGGAIGPDGKAILFAVPFGSLSFTEHVKKKGGTFPATARLESDTTVIPALRKQTAENGSLADRNRFYVSGGAVWAITTLTHPGDRRPFTPLTLADIDSVANKLAADPTTLPTIDFAAIKDPAERAYAESEYAKVKKSYAQPEQLLAGTEVLRAAAAEYDLARPGKTILFARHGYVGWLLAYVAEAEIATK